MPRPRGDRPALGLADDPQVVAGRELDRYGRCRPAPVARDGHVFARTSPEHKLRLVEALQADGAVVAMTGDGVNDAPALKRADVGVAMGRKGTEAAKEVAAMVLADDNFASIVAAVREGRTVYDNLLKVIGWTLPTNGGVALAIIAAILFDVTLPMTPVQILWVNLVSAVALGLTLAFEPTEPGTMLRPPRRARRDDPERPPSVAGGPGLGAVRDRRLRHVLLGAGARAIAGGGSHHRRQHAGGDGDRLPVQRPLTSHGSSLTWVGVLGTPAVLAGVATVTVAQLAFTYLPFMNAAFGTRPVAVLDGFAILLVGRPR